MSNVFRKIRRPFPEARVCQSWHVMRRKAQAHPVWCDRRQHVIFNSARASKDCNVRRDRGWRGHYRSR